MKHAKHSLKHLLHSGKFPHLANGEAELRLKKLQLKMLRIQQGVFHGQKRVLILFEGFDAAGKGGAIRRLVEPLDPRSVRVHAFGPPTAQEQGRHYLYRFWRALPSPGQIAIFDRTWYGRVLVERVEKLIPKRRWEDAYPEICAVEKMLIADGIEIVKIFPAITRDEQYRRFEERIEDPYKQWKLTNADIAARAKWIDYVKAADEMFYRTQHKTCPWHIIAANNKNFARVRIFEVITKTLGHHADWMEAVAQKQDVAELKKSLSASERK